jgi:Ca2+-binding RTX toxin-like protein
VEKAGNGIDTVLSSVGLSMDAGVENVTLTGVAAINATGNGLDNLMIGNSAANELNGYTGADEMRGGAGNDTYSVDNVGDVVVENVGEGIDTIISKNSLTLGANVENLTADLDRSIGTGNGLANILSGNALGNTLNGGPGPTRCAAAPATISIMSTMWATPRWKARATAPTRSAARSASPSAPMSRI